MTNAPKEKLKVQVWLWTRDPGSRKARVLMLKMRADRGGYWQPVTGSVEPEDTDLETAALRELREETGVEPLRAPKALGFEFTFQSRWGGTCRESVFETEAPWTGTGWPAITIDPSEHTEFKWMEADEAKKLLQFESNIQPLEILNRTRLIEDPRKPRDMSSALKAWAKKTGPALLLLGLGLSLPMRAIASQDATTAVEGAVVHKEPRSSSPELGVFQQGQLIRVSDAPVRDLVGAAWYRTRLPDGKIGYISIRDIRLATVQQMQTENGIDVNAGDGGADPGGSGWLFTVRGMGLGAAEFLNYTIGTSYEGEVSMNLGWGLRGYARRRFALGAAYVGFGDTSLILGSFVSRLFTESRTEPEVRVRLGMEPGTNALCGGLNFGLRWPFSLVAGAHLSGYVEGSGLMIFRDGGANAVPIASLGAGIGLHF